MVLRGESYTLLVSNFEAYSTDLVLDPKEVAGFYVLQINKNPGTERWQVQVITKGGAIVPVSKAFNDLRQARAQMAELKKNVPNKALDTTE